MAYIKRCVGPQQSVASDVQEDWILVHQPDSNHFDADGLAITHELAEDATISSAGSPRRFHVCPACRAFWEAQKEEVDALRKAGASQQALLNALVEISSQRLETSDVLDSLVRQAVADRAAADEAFQSLIRREQSLPLHELCAPACHGVSSTGEPAVEESEDVDVLPHLIGEYFRLARSEFVLQERLDELDDQHVSALYRDEHERLSYRRKRQALSEDLASLRCKLEAQREACLAAGHDPELFRYRRMSERRS